MDWSVLERGYYLLQRLNSRTMPGRLIRTPLHLLLKRTVVKICRGPAKGMKWIVGSSNHSCWLGIYELDKQVALRRFVRPGMTVYDIGAHTGFYSLFFARLVRGGGQVYAFEPIAENVRYLLAHIRMNRLTNIKVVQAAAAERTGFFGFSVDRPPSENKLIEAENALLIVPGLSLDDMVEAGVLRLPELIKIDTEGAEARVLSGMRRLLEKYRPIVFVALHGMEQSQICVQILESVHYLLYDLGGRPLSGLSEIDEIYGLPEEHAAMLKEAIL